MFYNGIQNPQNGNLKIFKPKNTFIPGTLLIKHFSTVLELVTYEHAKKPGLLFIRKKSPSALP